VKKTDNNNQYEKAEQKKRTNPDNRTNIVKIYIHGYATFAYF